ncbi:MAG TPA: energy transducer TonB [Dongiaceae bacterium]|nr:energy transducer TonB [Dongiaceae bacterium]
MTSLSHWSWPAGTRRLAFALAASAGAHAAVLANAPFGPEASSASLFPSRPPLRARLAERAPDAPTSEPVAQRSEPAPALPAREFGAAGTAGQAGLPAPEIFYRGKDVDMRAEATNITDLEYPENALAAGMTGKVTLRLMIDHLGALREARVTESHPPGFFEDAALKAARSLKFKPAIRNGVPVGSIKVIEVPFDPDCMRTGSCVAGSANAPAQR